jgi:hypothetical protein
MSNLRLKDHTWDAANVYDSALGKTQEQINAEVGTSLAGKQGTLVSGETIKTVNGASILGSGNIEIQGGGGSGEDGYSPVVTISNITGGHRVNITDKTHPQGQNFDVMNGTNGAKGDTGDPAPASAVVPAVESWLEDNITQETGYVIDDSLTVAGAAADAKKTGDEIGSLKSAFDYGSIIGSSVIFESGGFNPSGANQNNAKRLRTIGYIPANVKSVYSENGYQFGIYCYDKADNSYAGFVYANGNVGLDATQFTYRTSFDFDNPAYSDYNFRILCAAPSTQNNISVAESNNFILVKDGAKAFTANSIESIPVLAYNAYIHVEVGYGNTVSLLPRSYAGFVCAVADCAEGDVFTVSGTGAAGGRLWSFIDANNILLSAANAGVSSNSEIITAPQNSAKVIFNSSTNFYNFTRGSIANFSPSAKSELIKNAVVREFPTAIVRPTITHKSGVNQVQGVSDVKGSIFRNGNDFCIIYNENLDGNVNDLPTVSGTGTLAIKYKFFHYENGVESNVSFGELSRKGTTYTTWNSEAAQLDGGCGVPCGSNGLQYFSSAYTGTKRYNGIDNYGLRPCACEISVSSSGVTFGPIQELSLTINGEKGPFDIARIDPTYENYYIYYTTTPPCKVNDTLWYWLQPVINGIAAFKSTNGIDWQYIRVAKTPYQPACEVTCTTIPGNSNADICFAARTRETNRAETETNIFIGRIRVDTVTILTQYKLQSTTSRPYLTTDEKGILLFYNPTSYNECACVRVQQNSSNYQFFFHRWFSLYKDCTWYVVPDASSFVNDYTTLFLVGNNGNVNQNRGLSFMELNVGASPKIIADMAAGIE